jgi:hypothetical protein
MKNWKGTTGRWCHAVNEFGSFVYNNENKVVFNASNLYSEELSENIRLAVDAGNTIQKCDLLPSELLNQRDELLEFVRRITNQVEDIGREGCTYGDTYFDSMSAVYGYNLSVNQMKDAATELINRINPNK